LYLYGSHFKILTDHQPLKVLYNHTGKPSPRILRWGLRLQSYDFEIIHIPGHSNPAHILPINPSKLHEKNLKNSEQYINSIIANSIPNAIILSETIETYKVLQNVEQNILQNC